MLPSQHSHNSDCQIQYSRAFNDWYSTYSGRVWQIQLIQLIQGMCKCIGANCTTEVEPNTHAEKIILDVKVIITELINHGPTNICKMDSGS